MSDASAYRHYAESSDWQIDEDRERLLNELLQHRGYDERISASDLNDLTQINKSTIRSAIVELREEVGVPIGNRGNGYYIISDTEELEDIIDYYQGEIQTKRERLETIVSNYNGSARE